MQEIIFVEASELPELETRVGVRLAPYLANGWHIKSANSSVGGYSTTDSWKQSITGHIIYLTTIVMKK